MEEMNNTNVEMEQEQEQPKNTSPAGNPIGVREKKLTEKVRDGAKKAWEKGKPAIKAAALFLGGTIVGGLIAGRKHGDDPAVPETQPYGRYPIAPSQEYAPDPAVTTAPEPEEDKVEIF